MIKKAILISFAVLLASASSYGSGFQVLLQGNRQTGAGNIGVSIFPDASCVFFNPGAAGFMNSSGMTFGGNLIFAGNTYYAGETPGSFYIANSDNPIGTPFHLYGMWGPREARWKAGIGIYTPYGSGVDWGDEWMGQLVLRRITLQSIFIQPTISYRITDWLSVGGGFVYATGKVNVEKGIYISPDAGIVLDGGGSGIGFNLGMMIRHSNLSVGLNYRSKVQMSVDGGDAEFTVPAFLAPSFPEGNTFNAELPLPANLSIGATYAINEKVNVSAEANWVGWSAYKSLDFDFKENTSLLQDASSPRNYKNSWVYKLGVEAKAAERIWLRAGIYYDLTPVEKGYMTPETPDANRVGLTAGFGYRISDRFILDASFLYIDGVERTQTLQDAQAAGTIATGKQDVLPGTYELNALIPGVSISYNF